MGINNDDISTITRILKQIPLMAELNEEDHKAIINRITLEYYPKEYTIFKEGGPGDSFYIIKKGVVRVYHIGHDGNDDTEVAMLGDNDFFGEMALISDTPRNATTITEEETEVFKLRKEDFIQLVSNNPEMASRISSEFLKRFKTNLRSE
jgi:CRP-like cAMP-binding protein